MKKFDKITREGKYNYHKFGDLITVTEKLDGANASISIDSNKNIKVFSRNNELNSENTLRGWFNYAIDNLSDSLKQCYSDLGWEGEKTIYGEWLVSHRVLYKDEFMNHFYPFAIYDTTTEKYLSFSDVEVVADKLNLTTPQVFYRGKFNDLVGLTQYVGVSSMTAHEGEGEGIVIFNETNPTDESRTKIVSEKFSERTNTKPHKVVDLNESESWIMQYITDARINKILHKLNDEGQLPEISFKNFGLIASPTSALVYDDILEEEGDSLPKLFDEKTAKKIVNRRVPPSVRKFIEQINQFN